MQHRLFSRALLLTVIVCIGTLNQSSAAASEIGEETERFQAELMENLVIDVEMPLMTDAEPTARALVVETLYPDHAAVCETLWPNGEIVEHTKSPDSGYIYGENISTLFTGGVFISTSNARITLSTRLSEAIYQLSAFEPVFCDKTRESPDLPFASREEAQKAAEDILARLGIHGLRCEEIYALSHVYIEPLSDSLIHDPDNKDDIESGRMPVRQEWSEADDSYFIKYSMGYSGIPFESFPLIIVDYEFRVMGTYIEIIITKDGAAGIRAESIYQVLEEETAHELIPPEAAIECLKHYYRNVLLTQVMVSDRMELTYAPYPIPGEKYKLQMIPTWCFRMHREENGTIYNRDFLLGFDARNGKPLIDGDVTIGGW